MSTQEVARQAVAGVLGPAGDERCFVCEAALGPGRAIRVGAVRVCDGCHDESWVRGRSIVRLRAERERRRGVVTPVAEGG